MKTKPPYQGHYQCALKKSQSCDYCRHAGQVGFMFAWTWNNEQMYISSFQAHALEVGEKLHKKCMPVQTRSFFKTPNHCGADFGKQINNMLADALNYNVTRSSADMIFWHNIILGTILFLWIRYCESIMYIPWNGHQCKWSFSLTSAHQGSLE